MSPRSFTRLVVVSALTLIAVISLVLLLQVPSRVSARPLHTTLTVGVDCVTIQGCIAIANAYDTVFIPANTYTESFTLDKPVNLIGADANTTIINALTNQRVLTVTGATITNTIIISGLMFANGVVSGPLSSAASCGGGILLTNMAWPVLQNVVLMNNRASYNGGGLCADTGIIATLKQVLVISNTGYVGGGVYVDTMALVTDSRFIGNVAVGGGGLSARSQAVHVQNSLFYNNLATGFFGGGGLYVSLGEANLTNTQFMSNTAWSEGGGGAKVYGYTFVNGGLFQNNACTGTLSSCSGGGIWVNTLLTVTDTKFISNSARAGGGAAASGVTVNNSWFENNTAKGWGGGLIADGANINASIFRNNRCMEAGCSGGAVVVDAQIVGYLVLTNTQFLSNTSLGEGGALYVDYSAVVKGGLFQNNSGLRGGGLSAGELMLTGTLFVNNVALLEGGGIYQRGFNIGVTNALLARNIANANGMAIYIAGAPQVQILQTTIVSPSLVSGAAIYQPPCQVGYTCSIGVTNTIIASYTIGISTAGTIYENYNLFFGVISPTVGTSVAGSGVNDMYGNPAFVNPANDDYHLTANSAAINRGVDVGVLTDIDGDVRPQGAGVDIGYDEFVARIYLPLVIR